MIFNLGTRFGFPNCKNSEYYSITVISLYITVLSCEKVSCSLNPSAHAWPVTVTTRDLVLNVTSVQRCLWTGWTCCFAGFCI